MENLGILFSQFLQGNDSILSAHGQQVVTAANNNRPVRWLTAAFKRFQTDVVLPGMIYQIIYSITLSDLSVTVDDGDGYIINPTGNNYTLARFANPFGFGLQPTEAAPHITVRYQDADTAQLNLPLLPVTAGTSRGEMEDLILMFQDQTLTAINQGSFQQFFKQLADFESGTFDLDGNTDVVAKTAIGSPLITGIPFNVTTSLKGINSFNREATISEVKVDNPTPDFIGIHLVAGLVNPSNITLYSRDLSLPTLYKTRNVYIGRATIPTISLIPGQNNIMTLFQFMIPDNSTDVQEVLQLFVQPSDLITEGQFNQIPLQINGASSTNPPLSPFDALEPALEGIVADATLNGIGSAIARQIRVYISLNNVLAEVGSILATAAGALIPPAIRSILGDSSNSTSNATSQYVYVYLDARNDLPSALSIKHISSTVADFTNDEVIAMFDVDFVYNLAALSDSTTSPEVPHILLTKGLLATIGNLGHNLNIDTWIQTDISADSGTFFIPGLHYIQHNIDTKYCIGDGSSDTCILDISFVGDLTGLVNLLLGNQDIVGDLLNLLGTLDPSNPTGIIGGLAGGSFAAICSVPLLGGVLCPSSTASASSSSAAPDPAAAASSVVDTATSVVGDAGNTVTSVVGNAGGAVTSVVNNAGGAVSSVVGGLTGGGSRRRRGVAPPGATPAARYPAMDASQLALGARRAKEDPRAREEFKALLLQLARKADQEGLAEKRGHEYQETRRREQQAQEQEEMLKRNEATMENHRDL